MRYTLTHKGTQDTIIEKQKEGKNHEIIRRENPRGGHC